MKKYCATKTALTVLLIIIAACAAPPPKKEEAPVFYPEGGDLPRIQYLTTYTGAREIQPAKSAFDVFVTGEKEKVKRLDKPYGIAVHNNKIYVCDTNATVMVFDLVKKTFGPLQGAQGLGKLVQPINITVDGEGNKYVADPVRKQVVIFDKNDFYLSAVGLTVDWKPVDAAVYEDLLYVVDSKNKEIKVFDKKTGAFRKGMSKGDLGLPTNIAFDKEGYYYVSDAGRFQVLKFDRDGHLMMTFGKLGSNVGNFARPRGVALDREKRLYTVDAAFDNVQIFNEKGQVLFFFGKAGRGRGDLFLPAEVVIDYDNLAYFQQYVDPGFEAEALIFLTSQFGDRMVNVYALGKEKGKKYPTEEEVIKLLEERARKFKEEHPEKTDELREDSEPKK